VPDKSGAGSKVLALFAEHDIESLESVWQVVQEENSSVEYSKVLKSLSAFLPAKPVAIVFEQVPFYPISLTAL
jgi:hypothetical protein